MRWRKIYLVLLKDPILLFVGTQELLVQVIAVATVGGHAGSGLWFWMISCRPGRCLLRWMNDGSNGVKSFVQGLDFRPIDAEDKGLDPT